MRLPTLFACLSFAFPILADTPGMTEFPLVADHRAVPLQTTLYFAAEEGGTPEHYGGNIIFQGRDLRRDAPPEHRRAPLIVVSHGSGGSTRGLAWLGAGLAERGAIVLMLNHPGSTSGDSIPSQTVFLDRRAQDLTAALDHILADPAWSDRIDPARISALGFSLGGATVLQLAGARFDRARYQAFCIRYGAWATACDWMQSDGLSLDAWPESAEADVRDRRVSRVLAIDPAFGHAWQAQSLPDVEVPVQLINLGDTSLESGWFGVGVGPDTSDLVGRLPDARYDVIADAWHFSFLAECTFFAPLLVWIMGEDPICSDPWGSNRGRVHDVVIDLAAGFLGLSRDG